jgi:hypothetical protein
MLNGIVDSHAECAQYRTFVIGAGTITGAPELEESPHLLRG